MERDVAVRRVDHVTAVLGSPSRIDAEPPIFTYGWTCGCRVRSDALDRRWSRCGRHTATNPAGAASKEG